MAVRLVCRVCGKRLKLPDGLQHKRAAKCPKCLAPVDLTPALEASAYMPVLAKETSTITQPLPTPVSEPAKPAPSIPTPYEREEDSLPYPVSPGDSRLPKSGDLRPPLARTLPPPLPNTESFERENAREVPSATPSRPAVASGNSRPPLAQNAPLSLDDEQPLSLDDDPVPAGAPPVELQPFRVPVHVLADSHNRIVGPCFAVLVPHGLFLEREPMRPLVYIPLGCRAESLKTGELAVTLPEGGAITLRFEVRYARQIAADTRAFLAGERPVPAPAEYRRRWWLLWPALIFALGLAGGPLVLSQYADLGLEFGLKVGGGFALAGLLANVSVVLFSRWSVLGQVAVMAAVCVLVSGVFLFAATAYLAGRQKATEEKQNPEPDASGSPSPPPAQPPGVNTPGSPATNPEANAPGLPNPRAPSHVDKAYQNNVSVLEDGPANVTALAIAPDGNLLGIGYADGTTFIWPLDQPTFDVMLPGPKCDGPVSRIQFDTASRFIFVTCPSGVVAAPANGPPAVPAKISGAFVAVFPELADERIRFAAVRGNTLQSRFVSQNFVLNPPKAKGFALPGKGDEIIPAGVAPSVPKPPGPTFLAWRPNGSLVAGQPDGSIAMWTNAMKPEPTVREHKSPVRVWAEHLDCGDFATGDDQGNVGYWSFKATKPTVTSVLTAPITGLAFNPSGGWLFVTDNTGWLVVWDVTTAKAIHRVKRSTAVKAIAFGPHDDIVIVAAGKTVEVWRLRELMK